MRTTAYSCVTLIALGFAAGDARAETFHTCKSFITSVPTTITTQGVWCMDKDLASSLTSGALITIATNNVTIDCNDFKLGGLGAGPATATIGIQAVARTNVTIRRCNIRGFAVGASLTESASSGHRIVENRFDGNTQMGLRLEGTGHTVRTNLIVDTGGSTVGDQSLGMMIVGDAEISDNTVDGVFTAAVDSPVGSAGIAVIGSSTTVISGNRIQNIDGGTAYAYGIPTAFNNFITIEGNYLSFGDGGTIVTPYACSGGEIVTGNRVHDFGLPVDCDDDGGNIFK